MRLGIVSQLSEAGDDVGRILGPLGPHLDALDSALSQEERRDFYAILARNGHVDFVAQVAGDIRLPASKRRQALSALAEASSDDGAFPSAILVDLAARLVFDNALSLETRSEALNAIAVTEGARERAYTIQLGILRDGTTPPALRASIVEDVMNDFDPGTLRAHWDEIRAVWREVAETDPTPWVRARAAEMLRDNDR